MTAIVLLIPVSLGLGLLGLAAFVWSLRARQYEDLEGDQHRALFGGHEDAPPGPGGDRRRAGAPRQQP